MSDVPAFDEELMALKAIYRDAVQVLWGSSPMISITLPQDSQPYNSQLVSVVLQIRIVSLYPQQSPEIKFSKYRGLSEEYMMELSAKVEEMTNQKRGEPMCYDIIELVNTALMDQEIPNVTCSICLFGFERGDSIYRTTCDHYFHHSCLKCYLEASEREHKATNSHLPPLATPELRLLCPVCRSHLPRAVATALEGGRSPAAQRGFEPQLQDLFNKDLRRNQAAMTALYQRQMLRGGIIDHNVSQSSNVLTHETSISSSSPFEDVSESADGRSSSSIAPIRPPLRLPSNDAPPGFPVIPVPAPAVSPSSLKGPTPSVSRMPLVIPMGSLSAIRFSQHPNVRPDRTLQTMTCNATWAPPQMTGVRPMGRCKLPSFMQNSSGSPGALVDSSQASFTGTPADKSQASFSTNEDNKSLFDDFPCMNLNVDRSISFATVPSNDSLQDKNPSLRDDGLTGETHDDCGMTSKRDATPSFSRLFESSEDATNDTGNPKRLDENENSGAVVQLCDVYNSKGVCTQKNCSKRHTCLKCRKDHPLLLHGRATCDYFNARGGSVCSVPTCSFLHACSACYSKDHNLNQCPKLPGIVAVSEGTAHPTEKSCGEEIAQSEPVHPKTFPNRLVKRTDGKIPVNKANCEVRMDGGERHSVPTSRDVNNSKPQMRAICRAFQREFGCPRRDKCRYQHVCIICKEQHSAFERHPEGFCKKYQFEGRCGMRDCPRAHVCEECGGDHPRKNHDFAQERVDPCHKYNDTGNCRYHHQCRFAHICVFCRGEHPAFQCKKQAILVVILVLYCIYKGDKPLIVQFAANKSEDFMKATELVAKWAMNDGYGSAMIKKPDLIADIVKQTRNRISDPDFSISVKIRILDDDRKLVSLCEQAESAGISFITVHARTPQERHQPVHREKFGLVKSALRIPVYANGDVQTLAGAEELIAETNVDGVMVARGLLKNPALFSGFDRTPAACIRDWIDISLGLGTTFTQFHHHLMYMLDTHLVQAERHLFNRLQSVPAVLDFLEERMLIVNSE